jgi:AraC-like DNA-binding protein
MSLVSHDPSFEDLLATSPSVVGTSETWEGGSWPSHAHGRHQLIYAVKGVLHVETEGRSWVLPTSRALWIAAGAMHSLTLKRPAEIVVLYVDPRAFTMPQGRDTAVVEMTPLVRELVRACAVGYDSYEVDSEKGRLAQVLLDQAKHLHDSPTEIPLPSDRRARNLAEILQAEPENRESLDELSKRVGASSRTITRLFLDETHMSFGTWRQRLRLISSIEMLAYGENITTVAGAVGYESSSSYVAAFRSMFGKTPARYFG